MKNIAYIILFILFLPFMFVGFGLYIFFSIIDDISSKKCFVCTKRDGALKQTKEIFNPGYTDFERAYEYFWFHNNCFNEVKRNRINYDGYILKTLESIEADEIVKGWHKTANVGCREWRYDK